MVTLVGQINNYLTGLVMCSEGGGSAVQRDECLNGEIFYSLKEAQIVIEQWREEDNTRRPHSALNYRPPAVDGHVGRADQ